MLKWCNAVKYGANFTELKVGLLTFLPALDRPKGNIFEIKFIFLVLFNGHNEAMKVYPGECCIKFLYDSIG